MQKIHAFTATHTGIASSLLTTVRIIGNRKTVDVRALWDTGATNSCISKEVAQALKLIPTGFTHIQTPSGKATEPTYLVNICLPNSLVVKDVMVSASEIGQQQLGLLIGMDIISTGDFAVSNYNGKTVFTFRYPSVEEINFVKQIKDAEIASTKNK